MTDIEVTHDWTTTQPDNPAKDVSERNLNDHRIVSIAISGEDITSGTIADARIAGTIARDAEVSGAVAAEATARDIAIGIHATDTTNVHGITDTTDVILEGDARLTDDRTPIGPAGGDLSGSYPNPTVDDDSHSHTAATLPAGSDAPDDATYLVKTAHAGLSAEEVVGATPGGELGGTWASPTVDASHAGGTHAATQAAAEATAAAALTAHDSDTTGVHGIVNTANLIVEGDARLTNSRAPNGAAGGVLSGTYPNPGFAADMATQAELDSVAGVAAAALVAHDIDTTSVHGVADTSTLYRSGGTDVAVTDGGTGASDASGARTNLGLVIGTNVAAQHTHPATIEAVIDGGGSAITTGSKGYLEVGFACTITAARLMADATGSVVVDVKKATYSGLPTTASIAASAKPTLSSARKSEDTTLTGWTTAVSAGDWLEFVVDSATTVTRVTLSLTVSRP